MDYAGIRQYAPGDEYHEIEWKATARLRMLMVKEFHPETQTTLQILIDAGRTMYQQSYIGTKFDEALAVAQLLMESTVGSGNRVGVCVYNETEIIEAIKPATAEEQLASLRKLGLALGRQVSSEEHARRVPPIRASWRQTLDVPHPYPVVVFL
jgi:uncharacterized protein (DUF58 family)